MEYPWKKISNTKETNLKDIISEELVKKIQTEKTKRKAELLDEYVICEKPTDELLSSDKTSFKCLRVEDESDANESVNQVIDPDKLCDSDEVMAELLQTDEFECIKKAKDTEIEVNFLKYQTHLEESFSDEEEDHDDKNLYYIKKNGETQDNNSIVATQSREFLTGEAYKELPIQVYNQLKSYSHSIHKLKKDQKHRDIVHLNEMGIDEETRFQMSTLITENILKQINEIISIGKEAIIFHANIDPVYAKRRNLPSVCVIKAFKVTLHSRKIINQRAKTEMQNLKKMREIGINCPKVILLRKNILVMSFIGSKGNPAPTLKKALLYSQAQYFIEYYYEKIYRMMRKMYEEGNMVHGDLSEDNILRHKLEFCFIDFTHSVHVKHPKAKELLMKDCERVCDIFKRKGAINVIPKEELLTYVEGQINIPNWRRN